MQVKGLSGASNPNPSGKGPNINKLIRKGDQQTLSCVLDEDLPVIISRVMLQNSAAVTKVPILESHIAQLNSEVLNLEKLRDGQQKRIRELESRSEECGD